jgi:hypothetical protein
MHFFILNIKKIHFMVTRMREACFELLPFLFELSASDSAQLQRLNGDNISNISFCVRI